MADKKPQERRPDCVTEIRMGNSVLVVSGYFKKDTTDFTVLPLYSQPPPVVQ